MKTFENYPGGKAAAVADAKLHVEQDRLIKGSFYKNGTSAWRGCSIGCDVKTEDGPHQAWAKLFGTPIWFPRIVDMLFERLPDGEHIDWHVRVRTAMPGGVDISPIGNEWLARMLERCLGHVGDGDEGWRRDCRDSVSDVIALLRQDPPPTPEARAAAWAAAGEAAWAAAGEAAGAAAWAAAGAAAWAAAGEAAGEAAWAAAGAAAWAAAGEAAGAAAWAAAGAAEVKAQADDLIELLEAWPSQQEAAR